MKVTSWNLLHGMQIPPADSQLATPEALQAGLSELRHFLPDVIGLQEVDHNQTRSTFLNQTQLIANELGAAHWAFAPSLMGTPGGTWRALTSNEADFYHDGDEVPASYGIAMAVRLPVRKWHHTSLKKSPIGFPLVVPGKKRPQLLYVADEPRVALAAELENGWTVATTHLSFVPFYNAYQMRRLTQWLQTLPGKKILLGDMNMPWGLAAKVSRMRSHTQLPTYPSWKPSLMFDYILSNDLADKKVRAHRHTFNGVSDHLAISIEFED